MLRRLRIEKEYLPHSDAPPEYFFREVVKGAIFYRRAAGYFSSSVLQLFKMEILDFAKRGGKIELICSNQLANEDQLQVLT